MPRDRDNRDSDEDRGSRNRDSGRDRGRSERTERSSSPRREFKYHKRSSEDVSRRAKQSSSRYDSFLTEDLPWFKSADGENHIRLLPWLFEDDPDFEALDEKWGNHWGIDITIHRNVGPDKGAYLCLDKMKGEPCPICEVWRAEDAEPLKPSDRVLAWLIDRKNEKQGPVLWSMPLGVSKDFSAASDLRGDKGTLLVDNPEEGHDLYFDKEGQKDRTRYNRPEFDREATPIHDNEAKQNKWLAYVADHKLPDLLKFYEADYLEKILAGQISKRDEDDDEGEDRSSRPSRGRGRGSDEDDTPTRSSRRGRNQDDEDADSSSRPSRRGDPDEDPDADDPPARGSRRGRSDEDDPPASSRRARGRASDPEDGPDPEDPDEDPKEEITSRGGRKGAQIARRGKGEAAKEEADPDTDDQNTDKEDVDAARDRLKRVGRRVGR